MAKLCYAVVKFEDEWKVVTERRRIGRFASQALALNTGARLAREALAAGHEVELLVQDSFRLLNYDVAPTAGLIDARQGCSPAPADECPPPPWVRALEL